MANAASFIAQGDRAFVDEEFEDAVEFYSKAISAAPTDHKIYESRAKAYIKLEKYEDAVQDANKSVELSPTFAKGYLQKGIASFHLEEYEAAKEAFEEGEKQDPSLSAFKKWIRKCQAELDDENGEQAVPAPFVPQRPVPEHQPDLPAFPKESAAAAKPVPAPSPDAVNPTSAPPAAVASTAAPTASTSKAEDVSQPLAPAAPQEHVGKYRHQFYQLADKAIVDVYAKNLKAEQVTVTFQPTNLRITTRDESGEQDFELDVELFGEIAPDQCKYNVLRSKVEVVMKKVQNINWGSLQKTTAVAASNYSTPDMPRPSYPSSSTKKKDWSAVEAELAEQEKSGELDFGDPLSNFFKKIFSQGDEDQRRAMMKSFQESNGTVLSTNWEDVGKKTVECTPPEGMEVRKWES